MSPHITLLIIDPQNDFVDPHGSLAVTGALEDAERLVKLIEEAGDRIHSIALSLDSHQRFDISHPLWFSDKEGRHPAPFTVITEQDLVDGTWNPPVELLGQTRTYLRALEQQGRYPHMIWPEHCLIGSEGHAVFPLIQEALQQWSSRPARIDYIYKGQNPLTEHFSAVEAEVPDTKDPRTQVNKDLIDQHNESDEVWVSGWARSRERRRKSASSGLSVCEKRGSFKRRRLRPWIRNHKQPGSNPIEKSQPIHSSHENN